MTTLDNKYNITIESSCCDNLGINYSNADNTIAVVAYGVGVSFSVCNNLGLDWGRTDLDIDTDLNDIDSVLGYINHVCLHSVSLFLEEEGYS